MPLAVTDVEKLNPNTFVVHLTDGSYIVISAKDMAAILLTGKRKISRHEVGPESTP